MIICQFIYLWTSPIFSLFGLLVGLGAGMGIMILMEFLDNSFHTTKEVEHYLGAQVLASIADQTFEENKPPKARAFS